MKVITKCIRWRILDLLRIRWALLWLFVVGLTIVLFVSTFWMLPRPSSKPGKMPGLVYVKAPDQSKYYRHWGGNKTDHEWLVKYASSGRTDTPTFVVEEHHEVVKYWFQAANLGIIPKSGNTLVHIDGHSDADFPDNSDIIPMFRFPRNEDEVHNMMQSNDVFIVESALAGLIDHLIWVWPTWTAKTERTQSTYDVYDAYLGYTKKESIIEGKAGADLCVCLKQRRSFEEANITKEWTCRRRNSTMQDLTNATLIDESLCHKQADYVVEFISENLADGILAKRKWSSKSVLLDIDEDFFGCWSDVIPLYKIGVLQDDIDYLSNLVKRIFCVSTAQEEQIADRFYFSLLSLINSVKLKMCSTDNFQNRHCLRDVEKFINENISKIENFLTQKGLFKIIMCESRPELRRHLYLRNLMSFLANFSTQQLTALSDLGICMNVSPPTLHFSIYDHFHVCHGSNIPNNTYVTFHMPTESEITIRTSTLGRILLSMGKEPVMISICRSVRDGYTPKKHFDVIETNIMRTVHKVFRRTHSSNVHYDGNLLGGKEGWGYRAQPLKSILFDYLKFY